MTNTKNLIKILEYTAVPFNYIYAMLQLYLPSPVTECEDLC